MEKGKTEELAQPGTTGGALFLVDLESELDGQEPRDARFDPLGGLETLAVDSEVIGVSDGIYALLPPTPYPARQGRYWTVAGTTGLPGEFLRQHR